MIKKTLREAAKAARATELHVHVHQFSENGGISGVLVLAESHVSIHTWPERGFAAIDVFMCGDCDPEAALEVFEAAFNCDRISVDRAAPGPAALNWFDEALHDEWSGHGYTQRFEVTRTICEVSTGRQKLVIFETPRFGRVLALDGVVQTTEADEFCYHEMLAHVPIFAHGEVRDALIVGGGDGGVLREVLRHGRHRLCDAGRNRRHRNQCVPRTHAGPE